MGLLNGLRALAAAQPLLIAIDDLQWLDSPSADALVFVARRLQGEPVRFLLARRPGRRSALEQAIERHSLQRLDVGPMSMGATRQLLSRRLGLTLSRALLRRIVDSTLGNPLFVLELGRSIVDHGLPPVGEDMPVPDSVEDVLGTRVAALPEAVSRLLLAVALSADLGIAELGAIEGPAAVEDALDGGLLVVDGERVRASHPLLAGVAKKRSRAQRATGASPRTRGGGHRSGIARLAPGAGERSSRRRTRGHGRCRGYGRGRSGRPTAGRSVGRARAAPDPAGVGDPLASGCSLSPSSWSAQARRSA